MGKLYRVVVRYEGMVYAEDDPEAEEIAEYEMVAGESPHEVHVQGYDGTLPSGWNLETIPWGSPDKTLRTLLKEQEKEEVSEDQRELFPEEEK